jgi:hypothetical protein
MNDCPTYDACSVGRHGTRDSISRGYGSYANFDAGRFLVAGGGSVSEDGLTGVPTRTARVVDTRSGTPVSTPRART